MLIIKFLLSLDIDNNRTKWFQKLKAGVVFGRCMIGFSEIQGKVLIILYDPFFCLISLGHLIKKPIMK